MHSPAYFAVMATVHNILLTLIQAILPYLISGASSSPSVSLSVDNTLSTCYCNDSPAWSGPSFHPKDCATAVSQFFLQEVLVHGSVIFEFLAVSGGAQSRYPSQLLPQKFTYGETTRIYHRKPFSRDSEKAISVRIRRIWLIRNTLC